MKNYFLKMKIQCMKLPKDRLAFPGLKLTWKASTRNYHIQRHIFQEDYYLKYAEGYIVTFKHWGTILNIRPSNTFSGFEKTSWKFESYYNLKKKIKFQGCHFCLTPKITFGLQWLNWWFKVYGKTEDSHVFRLNLNSVVLEV